MKRDNFNTTHQNGTFSALIKNTFTILEYLNTKFLFIFSFSLKNSSFLKLKFKLSENKYNFKGLYLNNVPAYIILCA